MTSKNNSPKVLTEFAKNYAAVKAVEVLHDSRLDLTHIIKMVAMDFDMKPEVLTELYQQVMAENDLYPLKHSSWCRAKVRSKSVLLLDAAYHDGQNKKLEEISTVRADRDKYRNALRDSQEIVQNLSKLPTPPRLSYFPHF